MRVTTQVVQDITEDLAKARAVLKAPSPELTEWAQAFLAQRVTALELALEHAKNHLGGDTPQAAKPPRKAPRRSRAELDRDYLGARLERRRKIAQRITSYEEGASESMARNNWRHREAAVNRSVDAELQYRRDLAEHERLTALINRTTMEGQ